MRKAVIAAIAVVAVMAVAGIGFAVTYTGTVSTTSNVTYDGYRINILNNDGSQVSSEITFDGPDYTAPPAEPGDTTRTYTVTASSDTLTDYRLSLNKNMNVTAMIVMNDDRSWWLVDTITISVYTDTSRSQLKGTYTWSPTSAAATDAQWASWMDSGDVAWSQGVQSLNLVATDANALTISISYRSDSITVSTSENPGNPDLLFDMGGKIVFTGNAPTP